MANLLDRAKQVLGLGSPKSDDADRVEETLAPPVEEAPVDQGEAADPDGAITAFLTETAGVDAWSLKPRDYAAARAILESAPDAQVAVLVRLCERMTSAETDWRVIHHLEKLASALFARALPVAALDLERMMAAGRPHDGPGYYIRLQLWGGLARVTRRFLDVGGVLTPLMREMLTEARVGLTARTSKDLRKTGSAISELLGDTQAGLPDPGERWTDAVLAEVAASAVWGTVFAHAVTADGAKPSAKWLAEAEKNRLAVGEDEFRQCVTAWLRLTSTPTAFNKPALVYDDYVQADITTNYVQANAAYRAALQAYHAGISEKNIAILKGLAWYAAASDDPKLARALAHLTEAAFTNIKERGAWAKSAGNAALWSLGQMPGGVGVAPLARLRTRLRDRGALKLIAASIESAAKATGMTVDELEDLAVPTGGLEITGKREENFDMDGSATLTLDAKTAKTNLQWFGPDGKPRKAVPAAVKANHAAEVKALKAAEEEIKGALSAQAARFDKFLLDERAWPYAQWQERYLSHPVLGNIARRLIWTLDGIPFLPDADGAPNPPTVRGPRERGTSEQGGGLSGEQGGGTVKLWHPLGATPGDVLGWRQRLEQEGIVQPFKQAHREIYLLTDAERRTRTYSNRFAAHIIKQHQFNSLCVLRGWKNTLRLMVDDSYPPATRELPQHNLRAEFWVEGIGDDYGTDTNDAGTYLRLATDQVRFYALDAGTNYAHASGGGYTAGRRQADAEPLPLDQVPALAFSEVMRDIDLFVGVASVGNDPTWADGGPQGRYVDYWRDYAFGDLSETAKTRADVLARLLPRLKIAGRCRLDGKFLVVRGDLRTYKIHLGSGNILMEPNDQYLCIVPGSRSEDSGDLFLPFAGDRVLAVVLSKAFLLAADTQIADTTITRQIGANGVN